jgi:hypothetical protein
MVTALVDRIFEGGISIHKRIETLAWIINHHDEPSILILVRETLYGMLREEPKNAKVKLLIKKATSKIKI